MPVESVLDTNVLLQHRFDPHAFYMPVEEYKICAAVLALRPLEMAIPNTGPTAAVINVAKSYIDRV